MKYYARVDANQSEIVARVRENGGEVMHTHMVGGGAPDIIVGCDGLTITGLSLEQKDTVRKALFGQRGFRIFDGCAIPVEIKDGSKPPHRTSLTQDELNFHARWHEIGGLIQIWFSKIDVDRDMGVK